MTWKTIKSVININCTKKKTIKSNFVNNIDCTDDNLVAEVFGKYFSEVAGNLEAETPKLVLIHYHLYQPNLNQSFSIQYLLPNVKK